MNPFDLRGPQFLLFYAVVAILTIYVAVRARRRREQEQAPAHMQIRDPYLIACLRNDREEVIRVAILSLVDRDLLNVNGNNELVATDVAGRIEARKAVEQMILGKCRTPRKAPDLLKDGDALGAAQEYVHELERQHLLPDSSLRAARNAIFWFAALLLLGISATKIWIAISRGRTNLGFLFIMTFFAIAVLNAAVKPRLTLLGTKQLAEIRNLFESLKLRAAQIRPGGGTAEVALLTAVFGLAYLDRGQHAWAHQIFPAPQASSGGSDSSSSSGSSCGSSCGGGCGGGCGGCGG